MLLPEPGRARRDLSDGAEVDGPGSRRLAVVDIDGVLADATHREHLVAGVPRDWDAFFAAAADDPPILDGVALARRLAVDHEVVLLSGRPERIREATEAWLDRAAVPWSRLVLRPDADHRPARRFKAAALRELAAGAEVGTVVDDDAGVVEELVRLGYPAVLYEAARGR